DRAPPIGRLVQAHDCVVASKSLTGPLIYGLLRPNLPQFRHSGATVDAGVGLLGGVLAWLASWWLSQARARTAAHIRRNAADLTRRAARASSHGNCRRHFAVTCSANRSSTCGGPSSARR